MKTGLTDVQALRFLASDRGLVVADPTEVADPTGVRVLYAPSFATIAGRLSFRLRCWLLPSCPASPRFSGGGKHKAVT